MGIHPGVRSNSRNCELGDLLEQSHQPAGVDQCDMVRARVWKHNGENYQRTERGTGKVLDKLAPDIHIQPMSSEEKENNESATDRCSFLPPTKSRQHCGQFAPSEMTISTAVRAGQAGACRPLKRR